MDQKTLDDAIGVAPPFSVSIDHLMARQRRVMRWHRAVIAGAAALVVAAVGVAAAVVAPAADRAPGGVAGQEAPAGDVLGGVDPTEPVNEAKARLGTAMDGALHDAAPRAHLAGPLSVTLDDRPTARRAGGPRLAFFMYSAMQLISHEGVDGRVQILVARDLRSQLGTTEGCQTVLAEEGNHDCHAYPGPDGTWIRTFRQSAVPYESNAGPSRLVGGVACVWRPDATHVCAASTNHSSLSDPTRFFDADRPPLTVAQLSEIAQDPAITLYP